MRGGHDAHQGAVNLATRGRHESQQWQRERNQLEGYVGRKEKRCEIENAIAGRFRTCSIRTGDRGETQNEKRDAKVERCIAAVRRYGVTHGDRQQA